MNEGRAPIFGKWKYFYVFVVIWLIGMIVFFKIFSEWFS
jgi:hypothetical protein